MRQTDELRRLLSEQDVEYESHDDYVPGYGMTSWTMRDGRIASYCEDENGATVGMQATPAQAVEATLGRGTCEMVPSGTECEGNADRACTACDAYNIFSEYYDGEGHRASLRFCPNCGREVKGGVMSLESIDKLRASQWVGQHMSASEFADAIEREVEERSMELPCDANGEPIHVGDTMEYVQQDEDDEPFEVLALGFRDGGFDVYYDAEGRAFPRSVTMASVIRHVKRPTVEDVLREYGERVWDASIGCQTTWSDSGLDGIEAEYADKVREAVRAE